ncbi:MAG TPA: DUF2130 domain-containing protein, partial [Candidatus Saccharimonadales bacterium]|nr:DUF2130 domain-containing protein [Candidatus Saccharimonadales bacterium]
MSNTMKCPHCGKSIRVDEVLTHQIEEQVVASISKKHEEEIEEERTRSKKLTSQIDELLDQMRELKRKNEDVEIEMKKKFIEEEEKIRNEVRRKADDEHHIKDLEKDKKLQDAMKQVEELKIKMQQGSQQTQGESLEMEIENKLRSEFPTDQISEVKKGQRGADITQIVIDKLGRNCGIILWESKNAKWSDGWISKLKEDQRQAKADIAVLVSVNLPEKEKDFYYKDGIWVTSWRGFLGFAIALRFNLVSLYHERKSSEGKDEKMKVLYEYLTGSEFKHRMEGIVEAFSNLQDEIEKEKRWFNVKWARQEKEIRKVIDHTHGL